MNNVIYHEIFLKNAEAGFIADESGQIKEVNESFCQLFGSDIDHWKSTSLFDLLQDIEQLFCKTLQNKKPQTTTSRLKSKKQDLCHYKISLYPIKKFVFGSFELINSNTDDTQLINFENIFNSIQALIYFCDNENRFIQVNQRFLDVVGLHKDKVIGKNIFDIFPSQASGYLRDDIEVMVTKKAKRNIIETFQTKDGLKWFATDKIPYLNQDGAVKGIIGFSVDITTIKNVEKALKESEEKYRAVAETTLAGILILDDHNKIYFANSALSRMTGYSIDELNGMPIEQLLLEAEINDCLSVSPIDEKETPLHCEKQIRSKSGNINHVLMSATYIRLDRYEQLCKLAVLVDITDRKRAEEKLNQQTIELKQHLSEQRQIAYVSSHDLKEPLRMITSFVQLLQRRYSDKIGEEGNEYIQYAVEGVQRMHFLLNDLLIYSQISSKDIVFKDLDLEQILNNVKNSLSHLIQENNAYLHIDRLPSIRGDEKLVESLFMNLIENALKYRTEEPPEIFIKVKKVQNKWKFSISDNGIGIDKKYADRIFNIFQRLHTRKKYQGNGIGLSICRKVIEKHGGSIWIDSELGTGSTFHFTFPVHVNEISLIKTELLEEVHV